MPSQILSSLFIILQRLLGVLFILNSPCALGKQSYLPLPKDGFKCNSNQFFDHLELVCKDCEPNTIPFTTSSSSDPHIGGTSIRNARECTCENNHLQNMSACPKKDVLDRSGKCIYPQCSASPCKDQSRAISLDKSQCLSCGEQAMFDLSTGDCICPAGYKRVEMDGGANDENARIDCSKCPPGTKVISDALLGPDQTFHVTAGVSFKNDPYVCARCPDPQMIFDDDSDCVCRGGYIITGEASVGAQTCISTNYMPSISSDYSKVKFRFLDSSSSLNNGGSSAGAGQSIEIDSIILSHYYLEAASHCEFSQGNSERSRNACQTLINLCVLSSYDKTAAACRELQASSGDGGEQTSLINRLTYNGELDDILRDKSLEMQMSFRPKANFNHAMQFKLAKFSLGGEFLGFESLNNQFLSPCFSGDIKSTVSGVYTSSNDNFTFGQPFSVELKDCNLEEFIEKDMYLYELFIVDEEARCVAEINDKDIECLYPVPVLATNLLEDNIFPNLNKDFDDELNDKFVRRFVIFDNMSGRTSSGLQAIRYASKITIETTVQKNFPSKIYPPVLMIQYNEIDFRDFIPGSTTGMIKFEVEYNMITTQFWGGIRIAVGFLSAIAFLIWSFRIYNWSNRNRNTANKIFFIVHTVMIGLHTIMVVFLPFLFCLCAFWYMFYSLQDSVFLLLPSQNDFHLRSEYIFFAAMIICLFICQTIYIIYIVFQQCTVDIVLIDWENSKSEHHEISTWRKVMIANEFNKLQAARKTSLEVTLLLVCTFSVTHSSSTLHIIEEFATASLVWIFSLIIQRLWKLCIYERYISEPSSQRLIDLMTLSNISMIILDDLHHGYYLNCRSPFEFSDCSMETLCENMRREGQGLVPLRGLELDSNSRTPPCQTYEMFTSEVFQQYFHEFYQGAHAQDATIIEEIQSFLITFIDQSPSPDEPGLKRIVRTSGVMDRILGLVPIEVRGTSEVNILSPDIPTWASEYLFLDITFLGKEIDLHVHDFLLYVVSNLMFFHKPYASAIITYVFHLMRTAIRQFFGSRNFSKKTFLDGRFLSK